MVIVFLSAYALITLFPFYVLFVRTFVSTKNSLRLWLWIPPAQEVNLNLGWGDLQSHYGVDVDTVKKSLGIPVDTYISPRKTLAEVSEEFDIPAEKIRRYFGPFSTFNGWIVLLNDPRFWPAVCRTVLITVLSLIGLHILSIMTGYGLAGLRRRDQQFIYGLYLLSTIIPVMMILLPQFVIIQRLLNLIPGYQVGGSFTRAAAQIAAIVLLEIKGGALSTMVYTSYIGTIPQELEEAARIDGAGSLQYLAYVLVPLLKVPIASLTVMVLPGIWNQFLLPYVYLDPGTTTFLPLISSYTGQYTTNFQVSFTGIFLSIVPLATLYVLFRRWFIQGIMAGALKG